MIKRYEKRNVLGNQNRKEKTKRNKPQTRQYVTSNNQTANDENVQSFNIWKEMVVETIKQDSALQTV